MQRAKGRPRRIRPGRIPLLPKPRVEDLLQSDPVSLRDNHHPLPSSSLDLGLVFRCGIDPGSGNGPQIAMLLIGPEDGKAAPYGQHLPAVAILAAVLSGQSLKLLPLLLVSACLSAQAPFSDPSLVTVRVNLGIGDSAPATLSQPPGTRWFPPTGTSAAGVWNGQVRVSRGEIENLASLRPRPSDLIRADSWELESWQGPSFGHPPEKPQPVTGTPVNVFNPGLLLRVRSRGAARLEFQTEQGDFGFDLERLGSEPPLTFLEGRVSVEAAVTSQRITDQRHEDDFAAVATGPDHQVWVAWVGYRDSANRVFLRHYDGNRWEEAQPVTEGPGDVFLAKVARDGSGRVWVVWSDQIDGNRDLYARSLSTASGAWSPVVRLTSDPEPDLYHRSRDRFPRACVACLAGLPGRPLAHLCAVLRRRFLVRARVGLGLRGERLGTRDRR